MAIRVSTLPWEGSRVRAVALSAVADRERCGLMDVGWVCSFLNMLIECMGVKQAIVEYVAHASIGVVRYGSSTQMGHTKKNVKMGVREEGG